jgi:hypothetical protein
MTRHQRWRELAAALVIMVALAAAVVGWYRERASWLTSSPPLVAGIPAAPLTRRRGGFLLHWHLPGVALG